MAVMTTQQSEGVAFEQKIQPVPSSDKMALDLDINGNSNRDETLTHNHVDALPSDVALSKPVETTSLFDDAEGDANATGPAVNGVSNADAFASNQEVVEPVDISLPPLESQSADDISSVLNSSQLPDTNTTATTQDQQPSDSQEPPTSSLLASADSAIDTAVEDVAAPSTVPPVVEAQESDLRNTASPLAQPAQSEEQPSSMDFDFGTGAELPQGDNIVDRTADADVPDLSFPENIPDLPDLSADNQALQQPSEDFGASDPLKFEADSNAAPEHADAEMGGLDNIMADATAPGPAPADPSMQPPKIAREREDDDENEPSAKRTKTEEADLDQEMADVPVAPASNGEPATAKAESGPPTEYQIKELVKIVKNVARTKDGRNFRGPVAELWPGIAEGYLQKITTPMDLGTVEQKLKDSAYPSMDALKDDVRLLVTNATNFNGLDHLVTVAARAVRDSLFTKFENIPVEPAPIVKKEKKVKKESEAPARVTAPRRPSRGASTTAVQAPSAPVPAPAPAAQTFALDPSTQMPLIRRDSTKVEGGRPKREIHPPKNKDLPYSLSRPKNKKYATELKFCEQILKDLHDSKYKEFAHPFYVPVDPVALGIPNYFSIIKSPMDLMTASNKLKEGQYATAKDFEKDIRLIVANCLKFNPEGNIVRELGLKFERLFNEKWANKQNWISQRSPAPASPAGTPDSDEEESEEEEEEEPEAPAGPSGMSMLAQRLIEEQSKLIAMMKDKTDKSMIGLQQKLIDMIEEQVKEETKAQARPAAKKAKKPKAPKPKKAAPVKKAPAPKKSGGRQPSKYMGTLEKEVISAGIGQLPDDISGTVLGWIKQEQPGVDVTDDGTLELDIDVVSVPTLWRIHELVLRYVPHVDDEIRQQFTQRDPAPRELAKPPSKKKNKPMSKSEQEQKIELLKRRQTEFERQASGSQEPVPTVERAQAQEPISSGDEDSDSEEE